MNFLDPKSVIATFGLVGILAIIFAETGLLVGFFLPGDTLLFSAGIFTTSSAAGAGLTRLPLPVLLIGAPLCAIAGAQLGHYLGARYGRKLFERPNSRLFRQQHVDKAEHYFIKFGPSRAVVLARFIPVVRTFLNPLSGMLEMSAFRFFVSNVIGGVVWTEAIILLGRFLGSRIKGIDNYVLPVVALAVLISIIPVAREIIRGRGKDEPKEEPVENPSGRHRR